MTKSLRWIIGTTAIAAPRLHLISEFGIDSLKAKVFSPSAIALFLIGISLNLAVALLPLPDILQILGSLFRNVGLIAMGITVIRKPL
ncbi:MAG: hypothetical protein GVY04_07795 [Cyanobacteria bacterium]|jgi:hypothetical protein|nr:hypothetical protein [Cyanobacteria bacterium GSL.Bin1]